MCTHTQPRAQTTHTPCSTPSPSLPLPAAPCADWGWPAVRHRALRPSRDGAVTQQSCRAVELLGWDPRGRARRPLPLLTLLLCSLPPSPQSGSGQRSQGSSIPQKSQANKSAYNSYSWGTN